MALIETWRRQDLDSLVQMEYLDGVLFTQDNMANLIGVELYDSGVPYSGGGSVSANVVRSDGGTVAVTGTISGNKASVTLPQACYAEIGPVFIILKLTVDTTVTTIGSFCAVIYKSTTGATVDPGTIVPSIQTLISSIGTATAAIPVGYNTSFAPAYSTSATYDIGTYVTNDGKLYRCIIPVTSAGSWANNSGKFIQVAIGEDFSDLKNGLKGIGSAFEVLDNEFVSGYVTHSGTNADSDYWERTNYVPIGGEYLLITCPLSENETQLENVSAVAFYKMRTAETFISYVPIEEGSRGSVYKLITIPQDAAFAKFSRAVGTDHEAYVLYDLKKQFSIGNAKNVLPEAGFRSGEFTSNGITFKTNDDLSVTINGTATANAIYNIVVSTDHFTLDPGAYCLSGAEDGDANCYIHLTAGEDQYIQFWDERVIRITETCEYLFAIRVLSGKTVNNVTFKPMLEKGCIKHEYFPTKYDNVSLYKNISSIATENLTQFPYNSKYPKYSRRGIVFEVNRDGSVTMNGTATKDAYYMFVSKAQGIELPAGKYTLSGCEGGSLDTYSLRLYGTGGNGMVCTTAPVMQEYDTNLKNYRYFIYVKSGTTVSNVTISPMLEKGSVAHAYKSPEGVMDVVSIGGEISGKIRNAMRIFHQPWTALRDLDYYTQRGETTENSEYIGVPYASVFPIGGDVLYQRNMATFYSAVMNPASIIYQPLKLVNGAAVQSNYGAVCTSFTGWINGMPLQVNADELPSFGFERYDYTGIDNVAIGDCLLSVSEQHCIQIYDISVDATTYAPVYVHITDQSGSGARVLKLTVSEFEDMLIENGGDYELGRYPNQEIVAVDGLRYATDVIPDMGDRTYYYIGDTVEVYIASQNVTKIYIKKDNGSYAEVALSGLSSRTVNSVTVYDISSYMSTAGLYTITTDKNKYTKCQIKRINTGSISISGNTVTLSGYSDNLTPVWAQVFSLKSGAPGIYPSPTGYVAHGFGKVLLNGDNTFTVTLPDSTNYDGYYIRVNYETGFGQAFKDGSYVMY